MSLVKYHFHFEDKWHEIEGDSSQKLVEMTISKEIRTPHACLEGGCGSCKCKLIDGKVDFIDVGEILDENEKNSGMILACQSKPLSVEIRVDFDLD